MDILTIAAREGDRAYEAAQGLEAKAAAYSETATETRKRGRKAEEILAAGSVEQHGEPGWYHVQSQSSDHWYVVNLNDRSCGCQDHQRRGTYCKHLQAAELFADAQPIIEAQEGEQVVLEVNAYARGKTLLDKTLRRVRVNGDPYREAKTQDFDKALEWIVANGYRLADVVGPSARMGTVQVRYIYRKGQEPQAHDDALPVEGPRHRDRLFKGA